MNAEEVLKTFNIPIMKLIGHNDVDKWREILKDYRDFRIEDVENELKQIISAVNSDKPIFYYLSAVRRNLIAKKHHKYKNLNMPKNIKALFK